MESSGNMASEAVIDTQDLTKAFKMITAVDGLTLQIRRGEIFGLLGPDGAGKTTTIRLLAAIMDPTGGWAKVTMFPPANTRLAGAASGSVQRRKSAKPTTNTSSRSAPIRRAFTGPSLQRTALRSSVSASRES